MKLVIIIAIVFVLLIPATVFAQESKSIEYYEKLPQKEISTEFKKINENHEELFAVGIDPWEFDIDKELDKIYFGNSYSNAYEKIRGIIITDTSIKKIDKFIPVGTTNVGDVKINHETKKAYVTLLNDNAIMVIDVKTDKILKIISLKEINEKTNPWKLTIDEVTNTIYFSHSYQELDPVRDLGGIGIIDGKSDIIKNNIKLERPPWKLIFDEVTKKIFVGTSDYGKSKLIIIDSIKNQISNTLDFEKAIIGNFLIFENKLYTVQTSRAYQSGQIIVIDMVTEKILDSFETGKDPWSVGLDGESKRLFVTTQDLGIQIFDLESGVILTNIESTKTMEEPMIYDDEANTIFLGMSNAIKKIKMGFVQNIEKTEKIAYRETFIIDFPSYSKPPEEYIQRYQEENNYKNWFNNNFPDNTIEDIVGYDDTHVAGFPDNSQSPEYYIQRYFGESDYKNWYDSQFPNKSIQSILGISNSDMSTILTDMGKEKGRNEKYDEALELLNRAVDYFPENPSAHTSKGFTLSYLLEDEKAIISFNQALKIDPNYVNATFGLGDSNYFLGNLVEAKQYYEAGLELNPKDEYGLSFLGLTLSAMNDENGLKYIERSLEINPENIDLIYNKVVALNNLKKYEEAIQNLNTVIEKNPNDIDAIGFKNEILKDSGILKEQRLSSSFPQTVDSRCDLVYLIHKEGETHGFWGLSPSEDAIEKIKSKTAEYQQRVSDEPWNAEEIGLELHEEMKEIMIDSIMKKYSINKKFRSGMFDLITIAGTYDTDILRGLLQLEPEHYAEDVECGKLLKTHYFDSLNEINVLTYGESTAEKMEDVIDESIAKAENKKSSSSVSIINDKTENSKGGGCLIATATYGSELAPQVQQLRELRDNSLLQTESGTNFMNSFNDFYYSFSPIIADYERENPVFREAVKIVITPMISSLSILNHVDMDSEVEVLGYGISLIVLNVGMYVVAPVIVIMRMIKK
jgi:tetratricopeptide (TPR) repeat protein/DNA-binding beta-propeller fold protein YncE